MYANGDNGSASYDVAYFDIFGFEHIPKEIKKFIGSPKILYIFEKNISFFIICSKCYNEHEKIFKKEESIETSKILGLVENI